MMAQLHKDNGEACQIGEQAGYSQIEEEGNRVKQREGNDRQRRTAREPLQLLAQKGCVGATVTNQEENGSQNVENGIVGGSDLFQAVLEQSRGLPEADGPYPQAEQHGARRVDQRKQPEAAKLLEPLLGKTE
jgi:hypothetical protein